MKRTHDISVRININQDMQESSHSFVLADYHELTKEENSENSFSSDVCKILFVTRAM